MPSIRVSRLSITFSSELYTNGTAIKTAVETDAEKQRQHYRFLSNSNSHLHICDVGKISILILLFCLPYLADISATVHRLRLRNATTESYWRLQYTRYSSLLQVQNLY